MDFTQTNETLTKKIKSFKLTYTLLLSILIGVLLLYPTILKIVDFIYLILMVVLVIPTLLSYTYCNNLRRLIDIRRSFGNYKDRRRDILTIKDEVEILSKNISGRVDDKSWEDLNMDRIYSMVDTTYTTPGKLMLYKILRYPLNSIEKLGRRGKVVDKFGKDQLLRDQLLYRLSSLSIDYSRSILKILWSNEREKRSYRLLTQIFSLLGLASLISPLLLGLEALVMITLPTFLINLGIYLYGSNRYTFNPNAIGYLQQLLRSSLDITNLKDETLIELNTIVEKSRGVIKSLSRRKIVTINHSDGVMARIFKVLNILLLLEVKGYYSVAKSIETHRLILKDIFNGIGEIDALLAVASFRELIPHYRSPHFSDNHNRIECNGLIHPLVEDCVENSLDLNKAIVITGSNMSGKSTFLRTIGVNILLAQTIITPLAKLYSSPIVRVVTSINRRDNILEGKSFYYAEAERLLDILNISQEKQPSIFLIDELLTGTNSRERIIASKEILSYISDEKSLVVVTTHDYELSSNLIPNFKPYHFTDCVDGKTLQFDYKLKDGASNSTNGISLLEKLKYPEEIIAKCRESLKIKI
jgi:DNA mismatch repair ATPase MutS